ncbi:MAG: TonB-dependent receptor [Flavobacteriaceae bacterium]|nr:TonB-dependent receptor [Flavobacteriaceae bacterium]
MNINQPIKWAIFYFIVLNINVFFSCKLIAQKSSSTATITLKEISIEALKIKTLKKEVPYSISVIDFQKTQKIFQQLSLQEYLEGVPGLFTLNASNYAQDLRISIRGFGARSAFGIRGVKIIVDGIPETTPDGQGQLDNIPLGLINKIEVLRGPSASLYGNASGGVIYINTLDSISKKNNILKSSFGNYNLKSFQLISFLNKNNTSALIYFNTTETHGYRDYSAFKQKVFNVKLKHRYSSNSIINFQLNYTNSPIAQDAGGLTIEEVSENRNQARQRNVDYNTFEKIDHLKFGMNWYKKLSQKWNSNSYAFFSQRDFYGKLPFEFGGIIDLDRVYYGLGSRLSFSKSNQNLYNQFQVGVESSFQSDHRNRFLNLKGIQGDNVFDQVETFNNLSSYILDEIRFNSWVLRLSLRYDNLFIGTNNVGFDKKYSVFNYSLGISYKLKTNQYLFMNFSTSFETPTLSELSANPDGLEGLNLSLNPSNAINYELGWKFSLPKFKIETNVFYIKSSNEILPYELEAFPGRFFYNNTGATKRIGFELFTQLNWKEFQIQGSFTKAKYSFEESNINNQGFDSNDLPGIPKSQLFVKIEHTSEKDWIKRLIFENIGGFYANNSNTVFIDSYQKTRFQTGKSISFSWGDMEFFGGINNFLNLKYFDNIQLNAFGSRYYEPAAPINFFSGISLSF